MILSKAVLDGINALLTGEILLHLDQMGHSDIVVVADGNFPARRLATRFVDVPGVSTPALTRAIRTVFPLDDSQALRVMSTPNGAVLDIHRLLADAAGVPDNALSFVDRQEFYELASTAYLILRTGETRTYGNIALAKGVVDRDVAR
jgi:L-fucose mutarotase